MKKHQTSRSSVLATGGNKVALVDTTSSEKNIWVLVRPRSRLRVNGLCKSWRLACFRMRRDKVKVANRHRDQG